MIEVQVDGGSMTGVPRETLERAVRATLDHQAIGDAEISVALLDDPEMRQLNRRHLGHDRPTDVIAFALWDEGEPVVGDVYLGWEQALRQANEAGAGAEEELVRLVVHGTLHVLGWDHPEAAADRTESPMYRRQEALVREVLQEL